MRDPAAILANPATRDVLDFSQPVALMLVAVLHFIPDDAEAAEAVATLLDALPAGSYNDPMVLAHARALLTSSPEGACDYVDGDLREPESILSQASRTLDFTKPVALMLLGVLHHIPDTAQVQEVVRHLTAALAPGSYLVINHSTSAASGAAMEEAVAHWNKVGTPTMTLRAPEQITRFFDGLQLLEPGVLSCSRWRPDQSSPGGQPREVDEFCGVGRKA